MVPEGTRFLREGPFFTKRYLRLDSPLNFVIGGRGGAQCSVLIAADCEERDPSISDSQFWCRRTLVATRSRPGMEANA